MTSHTPFGADIPQTPGTFSVFSGSCCLETVMESTGKIVRMLITTGNSPKAARV